MKHRGFQEYQARYGLVREHSNDLNDIRKKAVGILRKGYVPNIVMAEEHPGTVYIFEVGKGYALSLGDVVLRSGKGYWKPADTMKNPGPLAFVPIASNGSVKNEKKSTTNQAGIPVKGLKF